MNDHRMTAPAAPADPPAPAWLLARFLKPGENVVWSRGPPLGPWREWALERYPGLGFVLVGGGIVIPLAGAGIAYLCNAHTGVAGFLIAMLPLGAMAAAASTWTEAERYVCHALTDRRLLVITRLNKVEQFDVDLLRRLLAACDAARPAGAPPDEHLLDVSKVRPLLAPRSEGVTEIEPILRMLRAFGQLQGTPKG
jgi:hypothetical protein